MNEAKVRDAKRLLTEAIEAESQIEKALRKLVNFELEFCDPKIVTDYEANGAPHGAIPPFFSEMFLYETFGKQDARTILAYLGQVVRACLGEETRYQELYRIER